MMERIFATIGILLAVLFIGAIFELLFSKNKDKH